MTICQGQPNLFTTIDNNYCPFIETLSFGSDIHIRCNNTYFTFNELNSDKFNWKFANQTSICTQNGTQQAKPSQCGVSRIGSNYLVVPMASIEHNEKACAHCQINYKPIAPIITSVRSEGGHHILYQFNITATGLSPDESFEILWAKRVSDRIRYSYNYWFLQGCIDSIVKIISNTGQSIVFTVDDIAISRVEFIIRRCNGTCRKYGKCLEQQFLKEISANYFRAPDALEKVSCNSDCLDGRHTTTLSTRATCTNVSLTFFSSTTTPLSTSLHRRMTTIIVSIVFGLLSLLALVVLIFCLFCRMKGKQHVYGKASPMDPDEHK